MERQEGIQPHDPEFCSQARLNAIGMLTEREQRGPWGQGSVMRSGHVLRQAGAVDAPRYNDTRRRLSIKPSERWPKREVNNNEELL